MAERVKEDKSSVKPAKPAKPVKRPKASVFGPPVGSRPDVLTDAETVVFPQVTREAVALLRPDLLPLLDAELSAGHAVIEEAATSTEETLDSADDSLQAIEDAIKAAEAFLASLDAPDRYEGGEIEVDDYTDGGESVVLVKIPTEIPAEIIEEVLTPAAPVPVAEEVIATPVALAADQTRKRKFQFPFGSLRPLTKTSRLMLLAILCLQAILTLRLRNTAFEDEALYLYAGRMELNHLLHGSPLQGNYASYFSGAPVLYPILAAVLNDIGGLALARGFSLAEMLATTALLYSITRRLFNERAALFAAVMFSVAEAVSFMGDFATYDATCLFLLALGAWIVVRTAEHRWPLFLLAAPVVALAVGVKYAGAMFVPTIAVLTALAGWPARGRWVLLRPVLFAIAVAVLLYGALRLGGASYRAALTSTTTNRAHGTTPVSTLLHELADWGGLVIVLAILGTVAYTLRVRTEPDEVIAPAGGRFRRLALGVVLTGTAFLAPVYQAHLHTDVSFQKHIGFGLFFAAPIAGFGLARVVGDHFRRPQMGVALWCAALVLGMLQAQGLFHSWPNSTTFVSSFSKYLKPDAQYLVEVPEVPIYYLEGRSDAQPDQFTPTYNISYIDKKGQTLTGTPGFRAAIAAGYFRVVAYNDVTTPATDSVIAQALKTSGKYYLAKQVPVSGLGYPATYSIWVKGIKPAAVSPQIARSARLVGVDADVLDDHRARR